MNISPRYRNEKKELLLFSITVETTYVLAYTTGSMIGKIIGISQRKKKFFFFFSIKYKSFLFLVYTTGSMIGKIIGISQRKVKRVLRLLRYARNVNLSQTCRLKHALTVVIFSKEKIYQLK